MADAPEVQGGPPAVDQTGNFTVWAIPGDTVGFNPDAVTKAMLDAASAKRITYSFLQDGYQFSMPQEKSDDPRLTSAQRRQSLGIVNPEFADLGYVKSESATSASQILKAGGSWYFVERRGVPQSQTAQVTPTADKVRAIKVTLGVQAPGPVDGSGKFTQRQAVVVDYVGEEHALTTGA